ncbi:amidohydrolase [Hyphomonas johnsonii]|uniref:Putative lipoprotein n=1 Tax=Hyphomonas johnsonii MHS-2 TaxID=1280950 RepID=A0A059FMH6_9PROT|nr:amidohydrolase [Hyphomonas johnsonii]KCZ91875.1 putative lipoprotein [Hyphomonas johnsonii MHS-2]
MRLSCLAPAALLLAACATPAPATPVPDDVRADTVTVFSGGTIYTGNPDQPTVDAVVVGSDGRIMATVPPTSADWSEDEVTLIDLKGAVMFPGFTDSHVHLLGVGQRELMPNFEGTTSVADLVTRLQAELEGKTPGGVLYGGGWIETGWPEGRMPVAADLDPVSGASRVILWRADGHAMVVNSAALAAAGITGQTPDPDGGRIERGPDGAPNGLLIDNAMSLVAPLIGRPDDAAIRLGLETGARLYASRGWTGGHNMSVGAAEIPLMAELDAEGRLPIRLYNALAIKGFDIAANHDMETDTIRNRAVKLYMDGALGSRGALLIAPYSDRPDTSGLALMSPDGLAAVMARADAAGVQLAIHAIGDLGNRRILDAVEAGGYDGAHRWRIEHAQIIAPEDLPRLAADGIIASMQPSHAIGDLFFAPSRLGMDRLAGAYAWRSLVDSGAVVIGGSDAPVEVGSPLIEFYAAVARKSLKGESGEGWHPEQALTREEALALFTSAAAYAAFAEDDLGTIEPGKLADFTVFDRDLMTVPEADILQAKPVMTVIGGEIVWQAAD